MRITGWIEGVFATGTTLRLAGAARLKPSPRGSAGDNLEPSQYHPRIT